MIRRGTPRPDRSALPSRLILSAVVVGVLVLSAGLVLAQEVAPDSITCPIVEGYEPTFELEATVTFDTPRGSYRTNCWYESLALDENGLAAESELILDAA